MSSSFPFTEWFGGLDGDQLPVSKRKKMRTNDNNKPTHHAQCCNVTSLEMEGVFFLTVQLQNDTPHCSRRTKMAFLTRGFLNPHKHLQGRRDFPLCTALSAVHALQPQRQFHLELLSPHNKELSRSENWQVSPVWTDCELPN